MSLHSLKSSLFFSSKLLCYPLFLFSLSELWRSFRKTTRVSTLILESFIFSSKLLCFLFSVLIILVLVGVCVWMMGEEMVVSSGTTSNGEDHVVNIYPLSNYVFASKHPRPDKDETLAEQAQRMRANYTTCGLRTCVEAVLLVELFKHPHLLLLQVKNSFFKLPGGRLRPGESEIDGLKRKLSSKLSVNEDGRDTEWEVGGCLGMWWRPDFETLMYPYMPSSARKPKECKKLFLVKLPMTWKFIVPKNLKMLAVPLSQIHENHKTYGPVIAGVPLLLSKFSFNIIED